MCASTWTRVSPLKNASMCSARVGLSVLVSGRSSVSRALPDLIFLSVGKVEKVVLMSS